MSPDGKDVKVQCYKGIWGINSEQLWGTTLNPEHRIFKQVAIDNAVEADRVFSMLMAMRCYQEENLSKRMQNMLRLMCN